MKPLFASLTLLVGYAVGVAFRGAIFTAGGWLFLSAVGVV